MKTNTKTYTRIELQHSSDNGATWRRQCSRVISDEVKKEWYVKTEAEAIRQLRASMEDKIQYQQNLRFFIDLGAAKRSEFRLVRCECTPLDVRL